MYRWQVVEGGEEELGGEQGAGGGGGAGDEDEGGAHGQLGARGEGEGHPAGDRLGHHARAHREELCHRGPQAPGQPNCKLK